MQRTARVLLWALPAATLLCACGGLRHIRVEEVRSVSVQPVGGGKMRVSMDAKISNPSRRTVQLTKLELNVELEGSVIATISTLETVTAPPRSSAFQPVLLELRLRNLISTVIMIQQKKISPDNLTVEGELHAGAFPLSKTIKIEKQPLNAFAAQYGDLVTPLFLMIND
ncbi:MAG: LEA type 2 family protein [Prevotellaceae bacterium]|nr:LEA type 2 family protein [Prevotellaceae bacterium]